MLVLIPGELQDALRRVPNPVLRSRRMAEELAGEEQAALAPYFTNLTGPVFALVNLPEVVKGALFARYSRSPKSLRRLFLDEFLGPGGLEAASLGGAAGDAGARRAEQLFERVFVEYGDDSVAQLGGVHLACEGSSNILTKVLEWGRLMAYLEQSTRYIPYDDRPDGRYRYHVPAELSGALRERYVATLDRAFDLYRNGLPKLRAFFEAKFPRDAAESETVYRMTIRAKALDTLRGMLPAATTSNVGIYATGQAYEQLLLRMRAHPLREVRDCADLMLVELRKVIPAFLKRVDVPERGGIWSTYFEETRRDTRDVTRRFVPPEPAGGQRHADLGRAEEVMLTDFDPDGEAKVVAAALYAAASRADAELLEIARRMTPDERSAVLAAYVGKRLNRRHRPGRAFERTSYRFDVLGDYGAFRDLQRHRLLTLEWQRLTPRHGSVMPEALADAGAGDDWRRVLAESAELHDAIEAAGLPEVASYAVSMAYRVRFYMDMNAREAMHVIELRTTPQGHPSYRRICQAMHRLIAERHPAIAATMTFADHSSVGLERLEAERAAERRRSGSA
jgi:thymidylate synthase ThyX